MFFGVTFFRKFYSFNFAQFSHRKSLKDNLN